MSITFTVEQIETAKDAAIEKLRLALKKSTSEHSLNNIAQHIANVADGLGAIAEGCHYPPEAKDPLRYMVIDIQRTVTSATNRKLPADRIHQKRAEVRLAMECLAEALNILPQFLDTLQAIEERTPTTPPAGALGRT